MQVAVCGQAFGLTTDERYPASKRFDKLPFIEWTGKGMS
jgi:hypothetical protein